MLLDTSLLQRIDERSSLLLWSMHLYSRLSLRIVDFVSSIYENDGDEMTRGATGKSLRNRSHARAVFIFLMQDRLE